MSDIVEINDDSIDMSLPLTRAEAEELTAHIRNAADVMWVLIARAHAGRVWEALDYPSWEAYVQDEFNMSRTRAYQLLDQAKVIQAIQAAAPVGTQVSINEKTARDLKKVLGEVAEDVAQTTQGMSPDEAEATIDDILNEWREKESDSDYNSGSGGSLGSDHYGYGDDDGPFPSGAQTLGQTSSESYLNNLDDDFADLDIESFFAEEGIVPGDVELEDEDEVKPKKPTPADTGVDPAVLRRTVQACYDLYASLSSLKAMPEIPAIIKAIPVERHGQVSENLPLSLAWLTEFSKQWDAFQRGETLEEAVKNETDSDSDDDFDDDFHEESGGYDPDNEY